MWSLFRICFLSLFFCEVQYVSGLLCLQVTNSSEVYRLVYYGGVSHDLRKEVSKT